MTNERPQGEEQFHSKNYLLEIPCSHVKMRLKSIIIIIIIIITLFIVDDFQMYKLKCENYNNLQYIYIHILKYTNPKNIYVHIYTLKKKM